MSSGRIVRGRGRGRGGGRSRNETLPYTPPSSRSPTLSHPSSTDSTIPPSLPELQHEVPTPQSEEFRHSPQLQHEGPSGSASNAPAPPVFLPQGKDPIDGKTWIYPQGSS